jgi:hypothetical protein
MNDSNMDFPQEDHYTYAQYLSWPENERYELVNGKLYLQASASFSHRLIIDELSRLFGNFLLERMRCRNGHGCQN